MMNTWITAALGEVGGTTAGQWEDARSSACAGGEFLNYKECSLLYSE